MSCRRRPVSRKRAPRTSRDEPNRPITPSHARRKPEEESSRHRLNPPVIPAQAGIQKPTHRNSASRKRATIHPRHSGAGRNPETRTRNTPHPKEPYRSSHPGFPSSINLNFHARFHSFSALSLLIAPSIDSCASNHTNVFTPYRFVKPSTNPLLCSHTLPTKSDVTPT